MKLDVNLSVERITIPLSDEVEYRIMTGGHTIQKCIVDTKDRIIYVDKFLPIYESLFNLKTYDDYIDLFKKLGSET